MPPERTLKTDRAGGRPRPRRASKYAAPGRWERLRAFVSHPGFVPAAAIGLLLFLLCAAVLGFSRGRLLLAEGRILDESRTVRVEFQVEDAAKTERDRATKALMIPRVYAPDESVLKELETSLRSLPVALASAPRIEDVAPEIQNAFGLTADQFQAVKTVGADEDALQTWNGRVTRLLDLLADHPLVSGEEHQLALSDPAQRGELLAPGGIGRNIPESSILNIAMDNSAALKQVVLAAGFTEPVATAIAQRLAHEARPTYIFDKTQTDERRQRAAAGAPPFMITYRQGEVLARVGEVLRPEQLALIRTENDRFRVTLALRAILAQWAGVLGVAFVIATAFGIYVRMFYSEIALAPVRFLGLVLLIGLSSGASCWATIAHPGWLWAVAVAPVVFATMITVVAFEPRLGVASACAQGALIGAALSLSVGYFTVIIAAAGLSAWRLRDVRNRNDVVRAAIVVGAGLSVAVTAVNLLSRPTIAQGPDLWSEVLSDAMIAGVSGFLAGAMTLVVMPSIERLFGVTTGMTLSELRDPKQPLLRKLQLQAPGTFNHSHTVATLAEAAAEAVGADGLHVYVGALYHDIGKMNKPDYFVENQPRGFNRHSKLSPAMSLLVIVGHVKDGIELAREYRLPRSLHGYIETHHGTTLVEYFFDQARRQAEEGDADEPAPQEIEYRYPGPRPRTKEQAILMICDAVESATRAMPDPTPSRIQALVHSLSTKRLMDGQFDECELTLAELARIEEAVSRTLASIYHGRIAYPSAEPKTSSGTGPSDTRSTVAEQAG